MEKFPSRSVIATLSFFPSIKIIAPGTGPDASTTFPEYSAGASACCPFLTTRIIFPSRLACIPVPSRMAAIASITVFPDGGVTFLLTSRRLSL